MGMRIGATIGAAVAGTAGTNGATVGSTGAGDTTAGGAAAAAAWMIGATGAAVACALPAPLCHPIAVTRPHRAVVDRPADRIFDVRAGLVRFFVGERSAASRSAADGSIGSVIVAAVVVAVPTAVIVIHRVARP